MDMEGDELGETVAALARASGRALDVTTVLERTMAVLDPFLGEVPASLWLVAPGSNRVEPVATRPSTHPHPPTAAGNPGDVAITLETGHRELGALVVAQPLGGAFPPGASTLLHLAAAQIAAAVERIRFFSEVMELERLKSDFIARVSHELRTPLTIITGFLDTLLSHGASLEEAQRTHMLERSQVAARRLDQLIEELLVLSRLEGGMLTPTVVQTKVADVLEAVRTTSARPADVSLEEGTGASIVTDPELLQRALGLIVDNALKYGHTADVSTRSEAGWWSVEVRDRGPGFAADVRDTAFEMFARSQSASHVPGLGAGLAIARTIVEILDGRITIGDAEKPHGAVVTITLPT